MKMNDLPAASAAAAPEVFQQLGQMTRHLHDTLGQLGLMPKLQQSAQGLPEARSRLSYIARKTGEAAERVLTAVELAKQEHAGLQGAARRMAMHCGADPARTLASGEVLAFVATVEAAAGRIDHQLTDIMLAQDFHDLTGQVVAKVVALAIELEDNLVKLLLQAAAAEHVVPREATGLAGPVTDDDTRNDVVKNQGEVDELLASLGF
jgi:chemotaxis protein CheZ